MSAQIEQFLHTNLPSYLQETADLCAIPSVSAHNQQLTECAEAVAATLARHGLEVEILPSAGAPVVVGRVAGASDRTLLFYNHYDVQPPEPLDEWTTPPFEATLRDGKLFARGASDDKGQLIARLAALDAVRDAHGGDLPCGVIFVVEGQEEVGSPHIAQFVLDHKEKLHCHGAIWEEGGINSNGQAVMRLGVRGLMYVEFTAQAMERDAHSGNAHALPNAAWRLFEVLNAVRSPEGKVNIPGFYDDVIDISPADATFFDLLPDPEAELREHYGVREFVKGRHGTDLERAVFEPTCNIAGLTAGYQGYGMKTVTPATATAKVDFRLVPNQDPTVIFNQLRAFLDEHGFADVQLKKHGAMWPIKMSADNPLVQLTARTAETIFGQPSIFHPLGGGSTPIYAFARPLNIPVVSPGIGYWDNRTHAPDEHIRLSDFVAGAHHIALVLDGFADL